MVEHGQGSSLASAQVGRVEISKVEVNSSQPRLSYKEEPLKSLAASIKTHGIIQPVTVRRVEKGRFQLISGERRLQAARMAGLKTIPAFLRSVGDQDMLEMALVENTHREDLNPIEIALTYNRILTECDWTHEKLGERIGKDRATITNFLRLLKLSPDIQIGLRDGQISMGHARALINVEDVGFQLSLFRTIQEKGLSVRQVEERVRSSHSKAPVVSRKKGPPEDAAMRKMRDDLSSHFGTLVAVRRGGKDKGSINIPFHSTEDLNRILEILGL